LLIRSTFSQLDRYINDMSSKLEKPAPDAQPRYGVDVLCASWNPVVAALGEPTQACHDSVTEVPGADAESFLARFYACQQV
jgi:hypothetical protein